MIDTLGLNANLFNLWLELIALMEVNLVFSNHPETRKEVWHFYDYSSRGYMLPILHTGDNMWQILIEPVSLVRDRVLETLRLTASELKSDVSTNSTNPAYLTYIMDYIILYYICQEFFEFFLQFRIHCEPHIIPIWPIFRYWNWYTFALRLRWCKMSESNCSSCSQNKGATITLHPAYYTPLVGIEPTTPD